MLNEGIEAPVFCTRYREAEITKFIDNSFHALKVTFANEIGRVCVALGIDTQQVHEIFTSDTKLNISAHYLRPGGPFGGSCLPKDVRALQHLSADVGADTHVIDALLSSNEAHKQFLFETCVAGLRPGSRVLMLGLAFKSDSDDLRESPKVDLARQLLRAGYRLSIFDPALDPAKLVGHNLGYAYAKLPELGELLIDRAVLEARAYDRVIDTNGTSGTLRLHGAPVVDAHALGSLEQVSRRPRLAAVSI
jgi:GDP-mannose 6-dehydrogenase